MSINSILNQVKQFREATGLPVDSGKKCDMDTHRAVIKEELIEAADGMTDTIVTLAGAYWDADDSTSIASLILIEGVIESMKNIGLDPDECMAIVHEANMSKLCRYFDIDPTFEKYKSIGVESYLNQVNDKDFALYSSQDQRDNEGKFYPKHKLLKAHNWHEPDWSNMREWASEEICDFLGE